MGTIAVLQLTRISHRFHPTDRWWQPAAKMEPLAATQAAKNRGNGRRCCPPMLQMGLCEAAEEGMNTLCPWSFAGQVMGMEKWPTELPCRSARLKSGEHLSKQCGVGITLGQRHPNLSHRHPDLRADLE